jgi:hypothetical protein
MQPPQDPPRTYLRRILEDRLATVDDLAWYLAEAAPHLTANEEARLAVEELVDHVGRALGFDARHDEQVGRGVWVSPSGSCLIVSADDTASAQLRIGHFEQVRDVLLASSGVQRRSQVTGLCVVCGPVNRDVLDAAMVVRRASDHVRVIGVDALLSLARLTGSGAVAHDDVVMLLRPSSAVVDPLVELLARASAGGRSDR